MTNRNANESAPGHPAGQSPAAPQQPQQPSPPLQAQPPCAPETQGPPPQAQQLPGSPVQERRRRTEEGTPSAAHGERVVHWGDPRPRRRQDREAGPSDKQVYVPPVTLPPNREHQAKAMDQQKIQVAPSLLKGLDERNRPTMRRIPVQGMRPGPPGASQDPSGGARAGTGRTARVGVGSGVWPPPEDDAPSGARSAPSKRQRSQAAPEGAPAAAGASNAAARAMPGTSVPPGAAGPGYTTLIWFGLLVFLASATAASVWVLWRAANPPADEISGQDDGVGAPPQVLGEAAPAPSLSEPREPPPAPPVLEANAESPPSPAANAEPPPSPAANDAPPLAAPPVPDVKREPPPAVGARREPPPPSASLVADVKREPPPTAEPPTSSTENPTPSPKAPAASASASKAPAASASASPPRAVAKPETSAARPAPAPRASAVKRPTARPDDIYDIFVDKPAPAPAQPSTSASPSAPPATTAPPRPFGDP